MRSRDVVIRILEKCSVDDDGCLIFGGFRNNNGYGQISNHPISHQAYTHRVMYQRFVGPIPDGLSLDHLCRNRACCNPSHLEPVTHRENMLRSRTPGILTYLENRCRRGHDMADAYVRRNGNRMCRSCIHLRERQRRLRKKQAALVGAPLPLPTSEEES